MPYIFVGGNVEFGLSGRGSGSVSASYEQKETECEESNDCKKVAASLSMNIDVGITAKVNAKVESCDQANTDCFDVVAVGGDANSVIRLPISAKSSTFVGTACGAGCSSYSVGELRYVGNVSGSLTIGGVFKKSFSEEISVKITDALSEGGGVVVQ